MAWVGGMLKHFKVHIKIVKQHAVKRFLEKVKTSNFVVFDKKMGKEKTDDRLSVLR